MTLILVLFPALAFGTPCGSEDPPEGRCENSHSRVVWCEDNELQTYECAEGTLCGWNPAIMRFDCLAPACGYEVPASGHCNADGHVEYCSSGKVQLLECKEGTECGWNNVIHAYDCLKSSAWNEQQADVFEPSDASNDSATSEDPGGIGSSEAGVPPIKAESELTRSPAPEDEQLDGGCQSRPGSQVPPGGVLLLLLAFVTLLTRRRFA